MEIHSNFKDVIDKYPAIISEIDELALMEYIEMSKLKSKDTIAQMDAITKHVAKHFGINVAIMEGPSQRRVYSIPRMIVWWLVHNQIFTNKIGASVMGRKFNDRTHATVLHGIATIDNIMWINVELRDQVAKFANHFERPTHWDEDTKTLKVL